MTPVQPRDFECQNALYRAEPGFIPFSFLTNCEHTQRRLNKRTAIRHYAAGETLQARGRCHHCVHIILPGTARLRTSLPDGRTQILRLLMPSDLAGRLGLETAQYDATEITDVTAGSISCHEFEALWRISPEMTRRLLYSTLKELDEAREWLPLLGRKTAIEKLASFLLALQRRSQSLRSNRIRLLLGQFELADLLGLTHETISRQLANLRDQDVVECHGPRQIEILDIDTLVEVSGNDALERTASQVMQ